ncbi:hypothetical protein N7504_006564 [Penicillium tannophilum]|nr:hypothetical protein N7504_006564 [Penicillium tannophilum]
MKFTSSILLLTALSAAVFASPHDHDDDDDDTVTVTRTVTVTSTDYITRSTFRTHASSSWGSSSTLSSHHSRPTSSDDSDDSDGSCIANYHACTSSDTCCDNFQCVGYTQWNSGTCVNR